jgi:hypothetical protein
MFLGLPALGFCPQMLRSGLRRIRNPNCGRPSSLPIKMRAEAAPPREETGGLGQRCELPQSNFLPALESSNNRSEIELERGAGVQKSPVEVSSGLVKAASKSVGFAKVLPDGI